MLIQKLRLCLLIALFVDRIVCDYTVYIALEEFRNDDDRLSSGAHCDQFWWTGVDKCDIGLDFCYQTPPFTHNCNAGSSVSTGDITTNNDDVIFHLQQQYQDVPNPIQFRVYSQTWKGIQFRVQAYDYDTFSRELIDDYWYSIDPSLTILGQSQSVRYVHNRPGAGSTNLNFHYTIACAPGFIGQSCTPIGSPTTPPPLTMPPATTQNYPVCSCPGKPQVLGGNGVLYSSNYNNLCTSNMNCETDIYENFGFKVAFEMTSAMLGTHDLIVISEGAGSQILLTLRGPGIYTNLPTVITKGSRMVIRYFVKVTANDIGIPRGFYGQYRQLLTSTSAMPTTTTMQTTTGSTTGPPQTTPIKVSTSQRPFTSASSSNQPVTSSGMPPITSSSMHPVSSSMMPYTSGIITLPPLPACFQISTPTFPPTPSTGTFPHFTTPVFSTFTPPPTKTFTIPTFSTFTPPPTQTFQTQTVPTFTTPQTQTFQTFSTPTTQTFATQTFSTQTFQTQTVPTFTVPTQQTQTFPQISTQTLPTNTFPTLPTIGNVTAQTATFPTTSFGTVTPGVTYPPVCGATCLLTGSNGQFMSPYYPYSYPICGPYAMDYVIQVAFFNWIRIDFTAPVNFAHGDSLTAVTAFGQSFQLQGPLVNANVGPFTIQSNQAILQFVSHTGNQNGFIGTYTQINQGKSKSLMDILRLPKKIA